VDSIAGAEALISHIITQRLGVPCAHAPAFAATDTSDPAEVQASLSAAPKAAAEETGYTFLPCVLAYLHRAPSLIPIHPDQHNKHSNKDNNNVNNKDTDNSQDDSNKDDKGNKGNKDSTNNNSNNKDNSPRPRSPSPRARVPGQLTADDVDAVVVPYSALGGPAVLALLTRHLHFDSDGGNDSDSDSSSDNCSDDDGSSSNSSGSGSGSCRVLRRGSGQDRGQRAVLVVAVEDNESAMKVTASDLLPQGTVQWGGCKGWDNRAFVQFH
jgi:hypothetical protein